LPDIVTSKGTDYIEKRPLNIGIESVANNFSIRSSDPKEAMSVPKEMSTDANINCFF
jgi:hypothetical protein